MTAPARAKSMVVLAGDIGGTNTRLALFEVDGGGPDAEAPAAPHRVLFERTYPSASESSRHNPCPSSVRFKRPR